MGGWGGAGVRAVARSVLLWAVCCGGCSINEGGGGEDGPEGRLAELLSLNVAHG